MLSVSVQNLGFWSSLSTKSRGQIQHSTVPHQHGFQNLSIFEPNSRNNMSALIGGVIHLIVRQ
jgi:hypothetical protein